MHRNHRRESGQLNLESGVRRTIVRIQRVSKKKQQFAIRLDDGTSFEVGSSVLVEFGLHSGDEIASEKLRMIQQTEAEQRAKEIALNYISYRPRSSREVADHLVKKGFHRQLATEVSHRFQSLSLINDLEFARMFVRDRLTRKPMGTSLLRQQLSTKGITDTVIEQVLNELITPQGQLAAAAALAAKRMHTHAASFSRLDIQKRKKRIYDFLLRRGFSFDVINGVVRKLLQP